MTDQRSSAVTAGTTDEAEAGLFESMVLGAMHATLSSAVIEAMTVIVRDDDFAIQRATLPTVLFAKEILARAPAQQMPARGCWTPEQGWEYVEGLTDEHTRDMMRDMLASKGLSFAPAQGQLEARWTEDELALAFFDYSACTKARCAFKRTGGCHCVTVAYQAVNMIKHVLPRSFPLASALPSTDGKSPTLSKHNEFNPEREYPGSYASNAKTGK